MKGLHDDALGLLLAVKRRGVNRPDTPYHPGTVANPVMASFGNAVAECLGFLVLQSALTQLLSFTEASAGGRVIKNVEQIWRRGACWRLRQQSNRNKFHRAPKTSNHGPFPAFQASGGLL